jgi:hypothetical protein
MAENGAAERGNVHSAATENRGLNGLRHFAISGLNRST